MATSTVMEGRKAKAAKPTTATFEVQARAMLENVPINVMWADRDLNIRYMKCGLSADLAHHPAPAFRQG
jgi:hypothetical protein